MVTSILARKSIRHSRHASRRVIVAAPFPIAWTLGLNESHRRLSRGDSYAANFTARSWGPSWTFASRDSHYAVIADAPELSMQTVLRFCEPWAQIPWGDAVSPSEDSRSALDACAKRDASDDGESRKWINPHHKKQWRRE